MDILPAARLQMTLSLVFHMIFAATGIGLPLLLVLVERRYLRTGNTQYLQLARKWSKGVGLLFAVGAISGTALSFELGLLWPRYMQVAGGVVGHIFGLEGFAFFVEAIFIGLYLYGWDRLSPKAHWWCGVVIALSGCVSGILILGVNSWMQLPVGFHMDAAGKVMVSDPIAIFKRPAWVYMAVHSTLSCYMAVGFAVAAIYAMGWLRGRHDLPTRTGLLLGMAVGGAAAVAQPLSGDLLAKFVFRTQPAKFAAMEGQFATQTRAPLRLGGIPDESAGQTRFAIEIPGGLSFLAAHDVNAEVPGLDSFPPSDRPPVGLTHLSFQVMVILGLAMLLAAVWFWSSWWRRGEMALQSRWLLRWVMACGFFGFIALEAGWMVTEVGRQPWVIQPREGFYAGMRTAEAVTTAAGVQPVFFGFTVLYILLGMTVVLLLRALARNGHDRGALEAQGLTI